MTSPTEVSHFKEQDQGTGSPLQLIAMERRSKVRYPLVLSVRYHTLGRLGRKFYSGVGQAVNLSSGGALVDSQHELGVGAELEVRMDWPSLLDGRIPLQFVAVGWVVRCDAASFAVRFRRHHFRTLKRKVQLFPGPVDSRYTGAAAR
jgi:hypothetical protein